MIATTNQTTKAQRATLHSIFDRFRDPNFCGFNTLEHRNVARLQTCVRQIMITMHPYTLENNTDGPWITDLSELCDTLFLKE